ncbi:glycosyltransferase, partial [Salinimicrobium oceani]
MGISLDKIQVIFRGRDKTNFEELPEHKIQEIRKDLGIGDERIYLNVSRLLERKGQSNLLKAFRKVILVFPDSKLLIAGEGPYRDVLEQKIFSL